MQAKVIVYDARGRPVTKQDEMVSERQPEVYGWSAFMQTSCVQDAVRDTCMKNLILSHLHMLHRELPTITDKHLKVVKGDIRGGGVRVLAMKAMEAGALRMAPLVTGGASLARLSKDVSAPYVLKVRVTRAGNSSEWCLNGSGGLPAPSAVVGASGNAVTQHNWMPAHNPWPLWFMKRVSELSESNCMFEDFDVRSVSTFDPKGRGEAFADNYDLTMPVLVNTKALVVGDEMRVFWTSSKQVSRAEKGGNITWASQARVKIGKQQHRRKTVTGILGVG